MKITQDTTLHRNLDNCPNLGIVIAADGVRLDLDGHRVDGDGKLRKDCPRNVLCDDGIVAIGQKNVIVTGGTVTEFAIGVFIGAGRHNGAAHLKIARNQFPGALVAGSPGSLVHDCSIVRNGLDTDEAGIVLFHARNNRVVHNRISGNGDIGLILEGSAGVMVHRNAFADDPEAGLLINSGRNDVRENRFSGGNGMIVAGSRNRIVANQVSGAHGAGGGYGISFEVGHGTLIANNQIAGSSAAGIRVGLSPHDKGDAPPAADSVIRGNLLGAGNRDGVLVMKTARRIALSRNRAHDSIDDGFDVESRSTRLLANTANGNGDLGIEAVRGAIDRGGNRARGNGGPMQCRNIACG